jgi:hydrogenase nickel incorporation protein HypB
MDTAITEPTRDGADAALAAANRAMLQAAGVFAVSVTGGPGCGKTTLIRAALERLAPGLRIGVITPNPAARGLTTAPATPGRPLVLHVEPPRAACPCLNAAHVRAALGRIDLAALDVLLVENDGAPADPSAATDLGEQARVCVFSVATGDRTAGDHPNFVSRADLVVLNKTDLLSLIPFDLKSFRRDVHRANPSAAWAPTSTVGADGTAPWIDWLAARVPAARRRP